MAPFQVLPPSSVDGGGQLLRSLRAAISADWPPQPPPPPPQTERSCANQRRPLRSN